MVQWLRVCASAARGKGLIPWGTGIPYTVRPKKKKKREISNLNIQKVEIQYNDFLHIIIITLFAAFSLSVFFLFPAGTPESNPVSYGISSQRTLLCITKN